MLAIAMGKINSTKKNSKKEVIITEAARLFREKGYAATSMRDLAVGVGVEAASLYNHIKSKEEMLHLICFDISNRFTGKMQEVEDDKDPIIVKLEKLIRFHVFENLNHREEVYVADREWRHMNEPYLNDYRELRRTYRKRFTAIIQQGIDQHELKEVDANTAVMIILNAISAVDQWHRIQHKVSAEELETNMVTILIAGLKK